MTFDAIIIIVLYPNAPVLLLFYTQIPEESHGSQTRTPGLQCYSYYSVHSLLPSPFITRAMG